MSDNQKKQKKYKGFIFFENYVETMKEYPREYQDFLWLSIIRFMYFDENPDFNKIEDGMGRLAMRSVWTASLPYLEKSKSQFGNTNALKDNETKLKPNQNESETKVERNQNESETKVERNQNESETQRIEKEVEKEVEKESSKNSKTYLPSDFDFKASLISLGVSEDVATKFMQLRKSKGTQAAFNKMASEISKANADGVTANECIKMAVDNSWQTFEYEWYLRKVKPIDERKTERSDEDEEEYLKIATEQNMLKAIAKRIRKDEGDTYQLLDKFDALCSFQGVGHKDFEHFLRHFEKKVREDNIFIRVS